MNIELNRKECHVVKDLFPDLSSINLSRWHIERILEKTESIILSKNIDDISLQLYAGLFHNISSAVDGYRGLDYIEPADDARIFNLVLKEE